MVKSHIVWNKNHPDDKVKKGEVIHHKDGNHDNDEPSNQQKMTRGEHTSLHHIGEKHWLGKKHTKETKRKQSEAHKGKNNPMYGIYMCGKDNSMYGKHHTDKAKKSISLSLIGNKLALGNKSWTGKKHSEESKKKMSLATKETWKKKKRSEGI